MKLGYIQRCGTAQVAVSAGASKYDVWEEEQRVIEVDYLYIYVIDAADMALPGKPSILAFRFQKASESYCLTWMTPWSHTEGVSRRDSVAPTFLSKDEREWTYCPKSIRGHRTYGLNVLQPVSSYEIEDAIYMAMDSLRDEFGNDPMWTPELIREVLESIGIYEASEAWYNSGGVESD